MLCEAVIEGKNKVSVPLKIEFAFNHINYARNNSFKHICFSQEQRLNSEVYCNLLLIEHTASATGNNFSELVMNFLQNG